MKNSITYITLSLLLSMFALPAASWVTPVAWTSHVDGSDELTLTLQASIDEGWHVYDLGVTGDGPQPTTVVLTTLEGLEPLNEVEDLSARTARYDSTFMMDLSWWERRATLRQRFRVARSDWRMEGYVRYMCCDDESCLPPEKWKFSHAGHASRSGVAPVVTDTVKSALSPVEQTTFSAENATSSVRPELPPVEASSSFGGEISDASDKESLASIFFFGLIAGLLALLTPCVWPIIPMTVSFFLHRKNGHGKRDALLYGVSIFLIYLALGLFVTLFFGASALNALSTNAVLNIVFFALMVVFALSFFGYFDLSLPSSWGNAINGKARSLSGFVSILLMAFVLVIVSFSCTGPIIGTLLVQVAVSGEYVAPLIGMLGFALALALPFTLCALFPSLLGKLPKSGGWMAHIKVMLAFVELMLALKFLSVADMTMGWEILPRWLFIVLWAVAAILFALYLLGVLRFPCNYGDRRRAPLLRVAAVIPLAFSVYMCSGFFGNPLHGVSAFLPPDDEILDSKHVFDDYEQGMDYARRHHKLVFVDFTGYGCVNCRKMEAAVFSQDTVRRLLDRFVVIRLYTDSREPLAHPMTVVEGGDTIVLETTGEKWSRLQRTVYGINAQPFYVILNPNDHNNYSTYAYDEDVEDFVKFVDVSIKRFADK